MSKARMNHGEFQTEVADLGKQLGWRYTHVQRSRVRGFWTTACNHPGWPDMCPMWNRRQPGRHLAVELKIPPDPVKPNQQALLDELRLAGFETYVWEPKDLASGAIARILQPLPAHTLRAR